MALTSFEGSYLVKHDVDKPEVVCLDSGNTMEIKLKIHPMTGEKVFDKFELTTNTNAHFIVWKNAANVCYDIVHDQIVGTIFSPGPLDPNNNPTYIERAFCMTLAGNPYTRPDVLNCYVSASVTGGGSDPDDGSWSGDVN
jgi:hypothetical protein